MTINGNMNNEAVVPDGGWGWVIVFSSFMIHFIMDGITYSMGDIYLRPMMDVLKSNRGRVSTIFGILPAVTYCAGPIATILETTYGCRKITIVGACLAALGYFSSSLYANIWFYYIAIGLIGGFGFGLMYLAAIVSLGFYFKEKLSTALGIAVSGSGLGTMVFPWIMPYVINSPLWLDYEGALLLESTFIFMCIIFGVLMIPMPQRASGEKRIEKESRAAAIKQTPEADTDEQKGQLLPNQKGASSQETNEQQPSTTMEMDKENTDEYPRPIPTADCSESIDKKKEMSPKQSFIDKLNEQINLKLLKDKIFVLFIVSNFLIGLGFNIPYNFANDLAIDVDVVEDRRHWIIMSIGVSNCFGRLIIGYLADRKWVNRLTLYNTILIIAGLATMAAPLCGSTVYFHMLYGSVFGFFSGGYVGLTGAIVVHLFGKGEFSNALGIVYFFQGIGAGIGTPIVGTMRDAFSNFSQPYFWPYIIFGSLIVIGGAILFLIPVLKRQKERH